MASTKIINVLRTDSFEDVMDVFKSAKAEEVIFVLPKKSKAFSKDQHFISLASTSKEVGKNVSIMTASPDVQAIAAAHGFHVLTSPVIEPRKRVTAAPKAVVANLAVADEDDSAEEELDDEPADDTEKEESHEVPLEELEKEEEAHEPKDDDEDVSEDLDYQPYLEEPDIDKELEELEDISVKNRDMNRYSVVTAASTTTRAPRTMADILRPADKEGISLKVEKKAEKPQPVDIQRDEAIDIGRVDQKALDEIKKVWQSKGDLWTSREEASAPTKKSAPSRVPAFGLPRVNSRSFSKKIALWLAGGAIIVFAAVLYVSVGNAKLVVAPQHQEVDFEMKISASDVFSSINTDQNQIPGQLFNASGNHEGSYPASGERDVAQKARGTLTVYNNLTTAQALITTTRFESSNGMIFRTLTNVNVPAGGKINVEVVADRPGDLYNVGAGKFTIPAFKEKGDTARFEGIYGESTQPMKGGIVGKAKVVTESDFNTAKTDAEAKAVAGAVDQIKSQSTGLKILDLPNPSLKTSESSARVDEGVQDTFTYKASADVRAIGFKEEDLLSLINSYLDKTNKLVSFKDKIQIDYKGVVLNPDKDSLDFTIAVKGTAYSQVDVGRMKTELIGKNREQVKTYIDGQSAISSARVNFNPFWVRKIPKDPSNFQIDLEYK